MTDSPEVLSERRGRTLFITLNRPQALNALNSRVLEELIDAFAAFEADNRQRPLPCRHAPERATPHAVALDHDDRQHHQRDGEADQNHDDGRITAHECLPRI